MDIGQRVYDLEDRVAAEKSRLDDLEDQMFAEARGRVSHSNWHLFWALLFIAWLVYLTWFRH